MCSSWFFLRRRATALIGCMIAALGLGAQAQAQTTVTLTPTADSYIQQGTPTTNYGTATTLLARIDSANSLSRAVYLQFNLASLPAGTITSAVLTLNGSQDQGGAGVTIGAFPGTATAAWSETQLNWNNAFSLVGVDFNAAPIRTVAVSPPPARTYSWDVTAFINSRRSAGNATLALYPTAANTYRATFNSKEAATGRPQLAVTVNGGTGGGTPALFFLNYNGTVNRVAPNGSGRATLVSSSGLGSDGIALDVAGNHIYWTVMGQDKVNDGMVRRSNLNGTNVVTLVPAGGTFTPKQMKLDLVNRKMYWADREGMRVMRANLDGTQVETLVTTGTAAQRTDASRWCVGIALDIAGGKIYWTQKGGDNASQGPRNVGTIRRANLNIPAGQTSSSRTDIETLFSGLPEPVDLEVDLTQRLIYWTDRGDRTISRSTMDAVNGSRSRTILAGNLGEAIGITLDKTNNRIYYTNVGGIVGWIPLGGGTGASVLTGQGILTGIQLVQLP